MNISSYADKPAKPSVLVRVSELVTAYYTMKPDPAIPELGISIDKLLKALTKSRSWQQNTRRRVESGRLQPTPLGPCKQPGSGEPERSLIRKSIG